MVNVATSYSGHLAAWQGDVVIILSDGTSIRAASEDVTLCELGVIVAHPDGRRGFLPTGTVVSITEAEPTSRSR